MTSYFASALSPSYPYQLLTVELHFGIRFLSLYVKDKKLEFIPFSSFGKVLMIEDDMLKLYVKRIETSLKLYQLSFLSTEERNAFFVALYHISTQTESEIPKQLFAMRKKVRWKGIVQKFGQFTWRNTHLLIKGNVVLIFPSKESKIPHYVLPANTAFSIDGQKTLKFQIPSRNRPLKIKTKNEIDRKEIALVLSSPHPSYPYPIEIEDDFNKGKLKSLLPFARKIARESLLYSHECAENFPLVVRLIRSLEKKRAIAKGEAIDDKEIEKDKDKETKDDLSQEDIETIRQRILEMETAKDKEEKRTQMLKAKVYSPLEKKIKCTDSSPLCSVNISERQLLTEIKVEDGSGEKKILKKEIKKESKLKARDNSKDQDRENENEKVNEKKKVKVKVKRTKRAKPYNSESGNNSSSNSYSSDEKSGSSSSDRFEYVSVKSGKTNPPENSNVVLPPINLIIGEESKEITKTPNTKTTSITVSQNDSANVKAKPKGLSSYRDNADDTSYHSLSSSTEKRQRQRDEELSKYKRYLEEREREAEENERIEKMKDNERNKAVEFFKSILKERDPFKSYTIGKLVGRGGFGEVFCAQQISTKRYVALKRLRHTLDDRMGKIAAEIYLLEKFKHPNIVGFVETIIWKSEVLIITEYLNGGTVKNHLSEHRLFSEQDNAFICKSLLRALKCIHNAGYIHRDVKTSNILLTSRGECKLIDMGLTVPQQPPPEGRAGSKPYMAPEVIRTEKYNEKVDCWSVGCVVQEIVEGQPPYREFNLLRGMLRTATKGCQGFRLPSLISSTLADFCSHCFEFDPVKRWTSKQLLKHEFIELARYSSIATKGMVWSPKDSLSAE